MLTKIVVGVVVVLAALAAYVASRPSEFRISRSRTLAAPPEVAFAYVNDLYKFREWSPYEKLDPAMTREHTGPSAGPGAHYAWAGNNNIGEGSLTVTDSRPTESVTFRLDFVRPFTASHTVQFDFVPNDSGTTVTWSMSGRHPNFLCKAFSLFMDVDAMCGKQFEEGLANLDTVTAASVASAQ
jgi:uncharacterized protein YndB with AHSA1/START domain